MRLLLACLLLPFFAPAAHARCASSGIEVWPPTTARLPSKPMVIVQGFARDQSLIRRLKGARLQSGGHRVPLTRIALNEGAMRLTQAVFVAERPLKAGQTYRLVLVGRTKAWTPRLWSSTSSARERVRWVASDVEPSVAVGAVVAGEASFARLGCGPAVHRSFRFPVQTAAPVSVEVKHRGPEGETTYLVALDTERDRLMVGHGMCSGAFDVSTEGTHSVQFVVVDGSGGRHQVPGTFSFPAVR